MTTQNYDDYQKEYSKEKFFDKLLSYAKAIGAPLVYKALQLFYVAQKPEVPMQVKATIWGALGYLILPVDLVPDFMPAVGYGDDAVALIFALGVAQMYVDDEVREKAKNKLVEFFGEGVLAHLE